MPVPFRVAPALVALALAGCGQPTQSLTVENAWVRLPAVAGRPGAAYFTIRNGPTPAALIRVASPAAQRSELHESMDHAGVMSMKPIGRVDLAPRSTATFAPGGRHVMLYGLSPDLKPGGETSLLITLADDRKMQVKARLVGAGDPPPY